MRRRTRSWARSSRASTSTTPSRAGPARRPGTRWRSTSSSPCHPAASAPPPAPRGVASCPPRRPARFIVMTGVCSSPLVHLQMNLLVHLKSSKETLSMGSLIAQEENQGGCPHRPRTMTLVLQSQLLSAPHSIEWATSLRILLRRNWPIMINLWFLPSVLPYFLHVLLKGKQGLKTNQGHYLLQIHTKILQCPNHMQSVIVL